MRMCVILEPSRLPSQREKVRIYPPIEEDMLWKFIGDSSKLHIPRYQGSLLQYLHSLKITDFQPFIIYINQPLWIGHILATGPST